MKKIHVWKMRNKPLVGGKWRNEIDILNQLQFSPEKMQYNNCAIENALVSHFSPTVNDKCIRQLTECK